MKRIILMEVLRRLQNLPKFKKKIKIYAGIAILTMFLGLGAIAYTSYLGLSYVAHTASKIDLAQVTPNLTEPLRAPAVNLAKDCFTVAKSLLNFDTLLNVPLSENAKTIKNACTF
jgi:hypothetical protein